MFQSLNFPGDSLIKGMHVLLLHKNSSQYLFALFIESFSVLQSRERVIGIWDLRNFTAPVTVESVDISGGFVAFSFFFVFLKYLFVEAVV